MVSKGFPNVTTSGRQYNIGEKPSVILYTYINLHAGTSKPHSFLSKSPGLQCSNMVLHGVQMTLSRVIDKMVVDEGRALQPCRYRLFTHMYCIILYPYST